MEEKLDLDQRETKSAEDELEGAEGEGQRNTLSYGKCRQGGGWPAKRFGISTGRVRCGFVISSHLSVASRRLYGRLRYEEVKTQHPK